MLVFEIVGFESAVGFGSVSINGETLTKENKSEKHARRPMAQLSA